ncbi:hypothetical protein [Sulfuracidifex tepidarius]|nr:hypothetical protein [Sulfuracidifex tepidarius]
MEECIIIRNSEGFLVNSCTGEVVDFENYSAVDYSNLEYYERANSLSRKREEKGIRDMKKIVLNYLLNIMTQEEKEKFYQILNKFDEKKLDAAYYLAVYEYILEKEGKVVSRDYLKFLRVKGVGSYSIRQRKKILRRKLKEDPVLDYIYNEYEGDKEEALHIYNLLKKYNLIHGRTKKRKKILLEYLRDEKLKKELLEREKIEEISNTILLLNIRDFESFSFI